MTLFAEEAGVQDLERFRACMLEEGPVPAIERDIEAAKELGARGTPAVLVNGLYLGKPPIEMSELKKVISRARERRVHG